MHDVKVQFIICSFVNVHLEVGGCEPIGLSEFLDFLPLFVDHLSENLQFPLFLVELPPCIVNVVLQELYVIGSAIAHALVLFVLHELYALKVEWNQG